MSDNPCTPPAPDPLKGNTPDGAGKRKEAASSPTAASINTLVEPFAGWKDLTARILGDPVGKWTDTGAQLSAYVRENPGKTVITGIAAGLILGVLFPGRTKPHS